MPKIILNVTHKQKEYLEECRSKYKKPFSGYLRMLIDIDRQLSENQDEEYKKTKQTKMQIFLA